MKCYIHEGLDATSVCTKCGKFICSGCQIMLEQKSCCTACLKRNEIKQPDKSNKKINTVKILSLPIMPLGMNYFYIGHKKKALFLVLLNIILFLSLVIMGSTLHLQFHRVNNPHIQIYAFTIFILQMVTLSHSIKIIGYNKDINKIAHFYTKLIIIKSFVSIWFVFSILTGTRSFHLSLFGFRNSVHLQPLFFLVLLTMFIITGISATKKKNNKVETILEEIQEEKNNQPNETLEILSQMTSKLEQQSKKLLGTSVHNQVYELYTITKKIFDFIEKYPNKSRNLNQFVEYYLPTTIKLLDSYTHLQQQGTGGENITKSREKIKNLLNSLQKAYNNQLDSLFEDKALDIDAEISVMTKILKEEGLLDKG